MDEEKKIKVRFAPSPTGNLHVGATRVALFNYFFAKKMKGSIVLRIEDTDKERSKKEYEDDIMRSLNWLGITFDEGPFYQNERVDIYKKYVLKLLEEKKAYHCFCTKEELEESRESQRLKKEAPHYGGKCFSLSDEDVKKLIKEGRDFVVRIKVPENETLLFKDMIKGEVKFNTQDIGGDFVIARSDFSGLYNFVCVVDDYEMEISHVIRGEDHISNTPKQILISRALNFPLPEFAHISILLGTDKAKLSKRHGATSINDYKKEGYLKDALINFMAFLGWHPGGEREIYSAEEIINIFSLEDCQKSGAVFDVKKLDYINGQYIRKLSDKDFATFSIPYLLEGGLIDAKFTEDQYPPAYGGFLPQAKYYSNNKEIDFGKIAEITSLYKERVRVLSEITEMVDYFFVEELDYDKDLLLWKESTKEETESEIDTAIETISSIKGWRKEDVEKALLEEANKKSNRGLFLWPLRVALTGKKASAGPFDIVWILGPENSIKRLKMAKNHLKS